MGILTRMPIPTHIILGLFFALDITGDSAGGAASGDRSLGGCGVAAPASRRRFLDLVEMKKKPPARRRRHEKTAFFVQLKALRFPAYPSQQMPVAMNLPCGLLP